MASDDMPEEFAFTIRVNSAADPALAHALWTLPWGSRNRIAIELLALGLAAKLTGGALVHPLLAHPSPQKSPPRKRNRPTKAVAKRALAHPVGSMPASAPTPDAIGPATPAPGPAPAPAPEAQPTPPVAPAVSALPAADLPPPPASTSDPVAPAPRPPSSALSSLLGQFDDD